MLNALYCKLNASVSTYNKDERGVTAIEYGLIGVAVAAMLAVVLDSTDPGTFLNELKKAYEVIATTIGVFTPNA